MKKVKVKLLSCVQLFATLWTVACQAPLSMEFSPGKNTGVACHFLLQEIFPTQGSSLCLLHCRQILCHLSHQRSPIDKAGITENHQFFLDPSEN